MANNSGVMVRTRNVQAKFKFQSSSLDSLERSMN